MKQRIFSGAVLLLFLLAVVAFNNSAPIVLNIFLAAVSSLAIYELTKALSIKNQWLVVLPSVLAASGVFFLFNQLAVFALYSVYVALMFTVLISRHEVYNFKDISFIISMTLIIPIALRTLILLRGLSENHGMFYVLIAILSSWGADVGAYFAGTLFGKHKLCPKISPKKTVEGAIGGVVLNIIIMMICGLFFTHVYYSGEVQASYISLAVIGFVGSFISILGDLSFSVIKRSCKIKDYGQVIPGHGGILDRFDSVIFVAPFVYLIAAVLPII